MHSVVIVTLSQNSVPEKQINKARPDQNNNDTGCSSSELPSYLITDDELPVAVGETVSVRCANTQHTMTGSELITCDLSDVNIPTFSDLPTCNPGEKL